jgi:putative spermidine/putrescine transport system substrate-binding protein
MTRHLFRRIRLAGLVALAAAAPTGAAPAGAAPAGAALAGAPAPPALVLALPARGAALDYGNALRTLLLPAFDLANHVRTRTVRLPPTGAATPVWDITVLDPGTLGDLCRDGGLAHLDTLPAKLGAGLLPQAMTPCGVGAFLSSAVLTWDQARLAAAPGWGDFWNVTKFPGQRALPRRPETVLEIALMADGVARGDVYAILRSKDGISRAFHKLDQLRPYVVWYDPGQDPVQIVAHGGALMALAPNDLVTLDSRKLHRNFGLQWDSAVAWTDAFGIASGSARKTQAAALIAAATALPMQLQVTEETALGGTAPADPKTLGPALAAISPTAHLGSALMLDTGFWEDNGPALRKRFDAWLKH